MGHIVNLRTARKQAKRRQAEQEAARRRLAPPERTPVLAKSDKAQRCLDQHRIETGGGQ